MSITTRYAAVQDGDTRINYPISSTLSTACKWFFPCNETSGTTITDAGSLGLTTDPSTLSFSGTPNTVTIDHNAAAVTSLPAIGAAATIAVAVYKVTGTPDNGFIGIGQIGVSDYLKVNETNSFTISQGGTPSANTTAFAVVAQDEVILIACILDGAGSFKHFRIDGSDTALESALVTNAAGTATMANSNFLTVEPCDMYGFGLWSFAGGIPATYQADLAELKANWIAGTKVGPSAWETEA